MEHAIRAQITERLAENPAFYEKLSERLERLIDEMRRNLIDAAEAIKALWTLRQEALSLADIAAQQGLSEVSFAVYALLEQTRAADCDEPGDNGARALREDPAFYLAGLDVQLKRVSLRIEQIMQAGQGIVDWQNKEDVQRQMRRDIKRELRRLGGFSEEQLNELAASMVEMSRRKLSR